MQILLLPLYIIKFIFLGLFHVVMFPTKAALATGSPAVFASTGVVMAFLGTAGIVFVVGGVALVWLEEKAPWLVNTVKWVVELF
jgi:hypothetical protein